MAARNTVSFAFLRGQLGSTGESGLWPQALAVSRMQALCCLSGALVVRLGDEPPREFTGRLDTARDQGTRAQHGPETRQVEPSCPLKNAYAATLIPAAFSCRPQEISSFSSHEPTASPQLKTNYLQPESTKSNLLRSQCLTLIVFTPLMQTKPCAFNTDITATPFSF